MSTRKSPEGTDHRENPRIEQSASGIRGNYSGQARVTGSQGVQKSELGEVEVRERDMAS